MDYFFIRKILYVLTLLIVVAALFVVGRYLLFSFGDRTEKAKVALPPKAQETVPWPQAEEKAEPTSPTRSESPSEPSASQAPPARTEPSPAPSLPPKERAAPERSPMKKEPPMVSKAGGENPSDGQGAKAKPGQKTAPLPENGAEAAAGKGIRSAENPQKVNKGDSIYAIAERAYGVSNTSVVDRILEANPRIGDPDHLPVGQTLRLPQITEESLVYESVDGLFQVRLGTFAKAEFAEYLKRHPFLKDKEVEISPRMTPSGKTWYRVTAGKFKDREEALQVIRTLKEQGLSPYFAGFKKKN
jgi:phage tail protein X